MSFISDYMAYVENTETSEIYKKWCAVSAISACLQRRVKLQLGHIKIFPNMYIALVGAAGKTRKGTAIGPYRKLLEDAGLNICSESISTAKLISRLKNSIQQYELIVDGQGQLSYHCSLTLIAPELSVFIGYQEKKFLATLADWWDSNDIWTYETISRGTDEIQGVWFNFLGGITPELLQTSLPQDAVGGGLLSRMVLVFSDTRGPTIVFPEITTKQLEMHDKLLNRIDNLILLKGDYTWTESAKKVYSDWRLHTVEHPPFSDVNLIGYNERRAIHLLKLMMVMNASREGDMLLTIEDFDNALELLEDTEQGMPRALRGVGARDDSAVVAKIINLLETRKTITQRMLYQTFMYDASKQMIDEVIETLIQSNAVVIGKSLKTKEYIYKWVLEETLQT